MPESSALDITARVRVPWSELQFRASRSGGPGGQHVNTSSTRVELWWDAARSPSLTAEERNLVRTRLASRLTDDGQLRIVAATTRSQARNRDEAIARFVEVLRRALAVPRRRKATRPSRAVKERRLAAKRRQSERKASRRRPGRDD